MNARDAKARKQTQKKKQTKKRSIYDYSRNKNKTASGKVSRKKSLEQQHIARGKVYSISIIKCTHDKGNILQCVRSETEGRVKYITRRIIIK